MNKKNLKKLYILRKDTSTRDTKSRYKKFFLRIFISMFMGFFISVIIRNYFLYPLTVTNNYMVPAIPKDKMIFITPLFNKNNLKIGDVVLSKNPLNLKTVFISRIVAKNGDRIQLKNKIFYRNGNMINEDLKKIQFNDKRNSFPFTFSKRDNMDEYFVKERNFFLLSDNRDECIDSRELGSIPEEMIIGKMVF